MSLWAILAAPLLAGNDLSKMTPETVALLTNREVIAIDQDKAGKQGDRVDAEGPIEVWKKSLADGSAVGIFNRAKTPLVAHVDFARMGYRNRVKARDLWLHKDLGELPLTYAVTIPAHGVLLLRVSQ